MTNQEVSGYVFICNTEGVIKEVIQDSMKSNLTPMPGKGIVSLVIPDDAGKCLTFLMEIKNKRMVFDWEMDIPVDDEIKPAYFFGGAYQDNFFIGAARKREDTDRFFEEFMRMNNEQTNLIRNSIKDQQENEKLYFELSKLNNELINLQRDLNKKNQELEKLNEIKNQFIGMTAHDLRNPLGSFSSICSLLLDEDFSALDSEQRQLIEEMDKYSKHMLTMVNDLLDISVIESGKMNLKFQNTNIITFIAHAVSIQKPLAERKGIRINFNPPQDELILDFDPEKIEQVLSNLLSNAIKFSYPESEITVTVRNSEDGVTVSVTDQGQGIPEKELSKLFRPYGRTSTRSTGGEPSTGLGLAISRRIVEAHRGSISAESKEGEGAAFSFFLPRGKS
jgi:two-component system, OmpR family, sensor kinase